jgi:glycosyltransferase involved in cell wall biosynthesis
VGEPLVSVIVPTKDSGRTIERCLSSIRNQSYKRIELIVVDNNSTDGTLEVAKKLVDRVLNFNSERSSARNLGAEVSSGKYLLFVDSDMILSENVVKECVEKCEREGYDALYIPERIIGEGFWIRVRDFERSFYSATIIDAVRFIRKDLFVRVGGFDETLVAAEDWDLDRRVRDAGAKVGIINANLFHDEGKFDLRKYLDKKSYYTKMGFQKYKQKWRNDEVVRRQLGVSYRLFWVFLEGGKWSRVLRHPLLALGMYYLRFRVGLRYIENRTNRSMQSASST